MMISRKKVSVTIAIMFLIVAYPLSLALRELWGFSEALGVAIPSFIIGIGIGFLGCSILIPSKKTKAEKKEVLDSDSDINTEDSQENEENINPS